MGDCQSNCNVAVRVDAVEKELEEIKSVQKSECGKNSEQHKEFYRCISSIEISQTEMKSDLKYLLPMIDKINKHIESLKSAPLKVYEKITYMVGASALTLIVSIIVKFLTK